MIKKCLVCHKEFKINQFALSRGRGKYCSSKCFHKSRQQRIERFCVVCGKKIQVTPSELKRGVGFHCSKECRKRLLYKTCVSCGNKFVAHSCRYEERKFCSRKCYIGNHKVWNTGLIGFMAGDKNSNWKGGITLETNKRVNSTEWKNIRKQIYERDNWTCQRCKKHIHKYIQCHHKIPWLISHDDSLDNLITLCVRCHVLVEWEYNKQKTIFTA